jgi:hypothetical protein
MLMGFPLAPSPPHRTAIKPSRKPRCRRPDPLRDLQRARPLQLRTSGAVIIRFWQNDRSGSGFGRRRVACRTRIPGLCDTQ